MDTVLERFARNLPASPYASNSKAYGRICSREVAAKLAYTQASHPQCVRYLVFDVDREGAAFAYESAGLPGPTIIAINPINSHAHIFYEIDPPLPCKNMSGPTKRLLKRVVAAYRHCLEADRVITHQRLLAKNPLHGNWNVITYDRVRTLTELAESIPYALPRVRPGNSARRTGNEHDLGSSSSRNCTLFELGRRMAYDSVAQCRDPNELFRRVESHLQRENREMIPRFFATPIPSSEVVSIAWSVARWTWAHRQTLAKRERQTGIMELPKKPFLPKRAWMKEVTRRERLGQEYVAGQRKNETEEALLRAVKEIKNWEKQEKPTQKRVAELTGKNVRTVRRYWKVICALM